MASVSERKLRLGVAGLGRAFSVMLPTFTADPRVTLVAAADTRVDARQRFSADFSARSYASVEELCTDPDIEAIYIATPHQYHAQHAALAAQHGKHLLIEKPMALTLEACSKSLTKQDAPVCTSSSATAIPLMLRFCACVLSLRAEILAVSA